MKWFVITLLAVFWSSPRAAHASRLDGEYHVSYPCLLPAAECSGRSDSFQLWLWSSGNHLCGNHLASAHLGDRVDEGDLLGGPSIVGTVKGTRAVVAFKSAWAPPGMPDWSS